MAEVPRYLDGYRGRYEESPHEAALEWFVEARYGLFLHYGLYSLLGRHEWVQYREKIPVAEYEKLKDEFTAADFDAENICELALAAGMKYVNITTRHHDSFCLFESAATDFHSVNSPAGRDLVGELAEACAGAGLGLCLYYSHGRDWRHPHAPNNDEYPRAARPEYEPPEPSYAYGDEHDLSIYVEFVTAQITELLSNYGPVGAIWLDGIATPQSGDMEPFRLQELYDHVHRLQPQCLVSYKQGISGAEDFFAPEHEAVEERTGRPMEICTTMCPGSWGYDAGKKGTHLDVEGVWEKLRYAANRKCNLLLNTGPLPGGGLDPEDEVVLREAGERLRRGGFPRD